MARSGTGRSRTNHTLPCGYPWGSGKAPPQINGQDLPSRCKEWARTIGNGMEEPPWRTSEAPPSLARLQPGQRVGGDVYGSGRGHLLPVQAGGGHPAADGGTCLGARLRRGHSINGLVGLARPNHAQEAPTKEVMQLLVQLLPSPSPWH